MFSDSSFPVSEIPNPRLGKIYPTGDLISPIGDNMPNLGSFLLVLYYQLVRIYPILNLISPIGVNIPNLGYFLLVIDYILLFLPQSSNSLICIKPVCQTRPVLNPYKSDRAAESKELLQPIDCCIPPPAAGGAAARISPRIQNRPLVVFSQIGRGGGGS